jgi:hypothetical protein
MLVPLYLIKLESFSPGNHCPFGPRLEWDAQNMSSPVQGQHMSLQLFDQEPEDTSLIGTRGTHYVQQTMFRGAEVDMPLVHIAQV